MATTVHKADLTERQEWLRETVKIMKGDSKGKYGSEFAHCLLADCVLRSKNIRFSELHNCRVMHYLAPAGKKPTKTRITGDAYVIKNTGCSTTDYFAAIRDVAQGEETVHCVPLVFSSALVKAGLVVNPYEEDYLLTDKYNQKYAGKKWKTVRRSRNTSKAEVTRISLEDAAKYLRVLDIMWVAAKRAKNKEQLSFQSWEGDKTSQVIWWCNNWRLLKSLGIDMLAVASKLGDRVVSVQLFCSMSGAMFYCFTRRTDFRLSEDHLIYAEMDVGIAEWTKRFGPMLLNDGSGFTDPKGSLTLMKKKYAECIFPTANVHRK